MTLREWLAANGFSDVAFAKLLTDLLGRKVSAQSVCQWRHGTMPRWDVGDAIGRLTGGKVKPSSFAGKTPESAAREAVRKVTGGKVKLPA